MSGPGPDRLYGGLDPDLLVTNSPCDGTAFDGGEDEDNASFADARGYRVVAHLDGEAYDPSRPGCVPTRLDPTNESLEGSPGNDVLIGDGRSNRIIGQAGDDVIKGRGGDDLVSGFGGADSLFGGKGLDTLRARDGGRDRRLNCGRGPRRQSVRRDHVDPRPVRCLSSGRKHSSRHRNPRHRSGERSVKGRSPGR